MSEQLSYAEIERMRTILAQHDNRQATQEFDLNHPPRENYMHQEFPKCIYNHDLGTNRVVKNQRELDHFLASGWSKSPMPDAQPEEEPELTADESEAAEIAAIDAQLVKRGPGRPRKIQE